MPRRIDDDEDMPRRRRGAKAVAIEAEDERGLIMRVLLHSPKDMVAGLLAAAAICAIFTNALFLQAGRHPSPMFGGTVVNLPAPQPAAASPLPRPRPVELAAKPVESEPVESKPVEVKPAEPRGADKNADAKNADAMTNLVVKSTSAPAAAPANVMRPPAPIPAPAQTAGARRVAAVQRALTQYGYGQLKPTGAVGADTQAAILKFEHARKLPVTGQMSDRLVRELTAMTGHPID
ncbi:MULTISPECIES: peptidoglycan-binding domain-containing protein [Bradyrhizobium]|uniref:Peptidoglycan binding domain-containing protein n=2 Tax=Bradyrhizobium TaxID=374 RepID=A0ABY0PA17_9BRAD|nr:MULTISPECIES: peptidoglycan-binding domain-containing protein [Bradyrhizobium]SDH80540.1 Putative peptidoglycan binding domain-containing protein [Bradyrhizobium ottawaense]SEE05181.1 Putative peptidoglycan binding domain-containing protein [Bradyrhizobium lablabi]SHM00759.1 Putative peptidoglycan binding domain-containing protein [Bradyrhizobium lablabi]